ncbi:MAG: HAMP domain-containing histidine kinase [Ktedonobacterales bacterium]|nr:HAMP domain-containing histidine kinase [Ktedonobacterales bacterium]
MVPTVPALRSAEQQLIRIYDRRHRLRLTVQIARILLVLLGGLFVAAFLPYVVQRSLVAHLGPLGILAALEVVLAGGVLLGAALARHEHANTASGVVMVTTTIGACCLALIANFLVATAHVNTMAGLLSLIVAIIVAGLIGTIGWMLATTIFLNGFTILAVLWILPHIAASNALADPVPLLVIEISVQWLCATLLSYNQFYFQQTIHALSTTQISYEQAQQLDELKDQFISSVNHELRNPIMAMMNYVTILRQRNREMAPERRASYLDSLDETGRRVIQLIGSILDTRQIAQHPEDFEPARVPLKATLVAASRLLDPNEARMTERDLFISIPEELTVWGDEIYLQQIFTNLLSNAVKYSAAGTAIEVQMTPLAPNKRLVGAPIEITVRDYGLGVPAAQIPLLFHRFARLPRDLTSNTSGNGLGLYLCKVLTEAMGGRIWVESSGIEGEGSAFHLTLPTEAVAAPVAAAAPAALVGGRWPARQARTVLAAAVAVVVVAAAIVVTQQPATAPPVTGDLHFVDVNGGTSNALLLRLTGLGAAPNGNHYQGWIIDTTQEQITPLGALIARDGSYQLDPRNALPSTNLLANGNVVEVTRESQPTTAPTGPIVFRGVFPPLAMVHVRHLLVSFPTTPGAVGLLVGLLQQMQVLDQQTRLLSATKPVDGALNHCVILSQLILIEGKAAAPLPTTCKARNIPQGDGFGLLAAAAGGTTTGGYIRLASGHAALALQQSDAPATMHDHGGHVVNILTAIQAQVSALDTQVRQLAQHFDASQVTPLQGQVQALLGTPIGPPDPGAGPPPTPDGAANTAYAAYGEGQQMTDFTFTYSDH